MPKKKLTRGLFHSEQQSFKRRVIVLDAMAAAALHSGWEGRAGASRSPWDGASTGVPHYRKKKHDGKQTRNGEALRPWDF